MDATVLTIRCKTCHAPLQVLPGGKRMCACGAWITAPPAGSTAEQPETDVQQRPHLPWPLLIFVLGIVLAGVAIALAVMEQGGVMYAILAGSLLLLAVVVTFVVIRESHRPLEEDAEEERTASGNRAAATLRGKSKVRATSPVTQEMPFNALVDAMDHSAALTEKRNTLALPFDAYQGHEPFLFASYSHQDAAQVYPEIGKMHRWGYRVWYDEGICPGQEWPEAVAEALANAAFFLVFVSPRALASNNVRNEINLALKKKKPFLAIYLEDTDLPAGIELQIGSLQAIMKHQVDEERYHRRLTISLPAELRKEK